MLDYYLIFEFHKKRENSTRWFYDQPCYVAV